MEKVSWGYVGCGTGGKKAWVDFASGLKSHAFVHIAISDSLVCIRSISFLHQLLIIVLLSSATRLSNVDARGGEVAYVFDVVGWRSFLLLVVRPGAPSGFLLLVAMPFAPSSVLAPSSKARSY